MENLMSNSYGRSLLVICCCFRNEIEVTDSVFLNFGLWLCLMVIFNLKCFSASSSFLDPLCQYVRVLHLFAQVTYCHQE